MIGKVSARGSQVSGLLYYLFGPGRNEAHTDPHLIAGWRHPAEPEPTLREDGRRDFRHLSGLLQQPHDALGERGFDRPVWHCSVRAAPEDRMLSDDEWAQLAYEIMHRTGLAHYGQEDEAVRWIAVRHAADHIHLVAVLARQDGTRPRLWNDYYRIGEACRAAEHRLGLRRTAPRDRTAAHRPTRAESEKACRRGRGEPPHKSAMFVRCPMTSTGECSRSARATGGGNHMAQIGELWLPDMLLNEEYGQGLIHDYFRRDTIGYMYCGAMFDTYPADPASGITAPPSPPDEITDSDLITLSMLGIRVTGYEALIITQDRRKEIETLLASIPRTRTSSRRQAEGSLLPKATRGSCGSYCARRRTGRRRPGSAPSPRASSWPVSAPI